MKISERRIRDMVLGILLVLAGYILCACEGGTEIGDVDARQDAASMLDAGTKIDAGSAGLSRTDAGVIRCDIPSPFGDVQMVNAHCSSMSVTMRDYYEKAAVNGGAGQWGILTNLADLTAICAEQKISSSECSAAAQDFSKYCYVGVSVLGGGDGNTLVVQLGGIMKWTNSFQVDAALCTPQGQFAGWLCTSTGRTCVS